jgi:hypothetical protein
MVVWSSPSWTPFRGATPPSIRCPRKRVNSSSGVFIGIEEALERATAADLLPEGSRAFGFGALATVNGIGDLVSSTMVGFLWQTAGATVAFGTAAVLSIAGTLLLRSVAFSSTNTEVHT